MPILGLMSSEQFESERFKNTRRAVLYKYPAGSAPLAGLTSMLKEETTNDPKFFWYNKTLNTRTTVTRTATPVTSDPPTGPGWAGGTTIGAGPTVAGSSYWLKVVDVQQMRVGAILRNKVTSQSWLVEEITNSSATLGVVKVRAINGIANVQAADQSVTVVGNASAEGARSGTGIWNAPVSEYNFTQIIRTPFVPVTGTAMKTAAKWDEEGPYKDIAKEGSLMHLVDLELNLFFGERSEVLDANGVPTRTTGGVIRYLASGTGDDDDAARIITNSSGIITEAKLDTWFERVFRVGSNQANEKLGFCGSGFLKVLNQLYKSKSVLQADFPAADSYGMSVVKHITPFGTIYWKSHPLFNQDSVWRNEAVILDVHNLKYRYINDRDGVLLKNRQENDADYRKDEWLTECGLEVHFPDSHMYIKNVLGYEP